MPAGNQRLTFISYSRVDSAFALELAKELRSSGFNIWFDQVDIPTGSRWDDEVEKALLACDIFMVILTPHSIASNNVKDEIGYAIDSNKRIMPVLLQNAAVPFRLRRFQYVDFTGKSREDGIESAKQLLKKLLNESPSGETHVLDEVPQVNGRVFPKRLMEEQAVPTREPSSLPPIPVKAQRQPWPGGQTSEPTQSNPPPSGRPAGGRKPILIGTVLFLLICVVIGSFTLYLLSPVMPTETAVIQQSVAPISPALNTTKELFETATFTAVQDPRYTPTFTRVPSTVITVIPSNTPPPTVTTIPSDPSAFIHFYFDNINNRNYDLTWSLLSDEYKATTNPGGMSPYITFWNGYSRVELTYVDYSYITPTSAKVVLTAVFYKVNSSSTSNITYYLTSNNPQSTWLFDIAPATGGSSSDTTCSTVSKTLSVGIAAQVVTATDPLLLRESPTVDATVYEKLSPGTIVYVVDGPVCGSYRSVHFWWWKVRAPSGKLGWVVEGSDVTDPYFILPTD